MNKKLTIGMATYDDYDGVYFTIQSLRMYHDICNSQDVEFVVIDNNPESASGKATKGFITNWIKGKYIPVTDRKTTAIRNEIFKHAEGDVTICMDPHVLLWRDSITKLLEYYEDPGSHKNIVSGPMMYDNLTTMSTHFDLVWRDHMYGIWGNNKEAYDKGEPFEIPAHGLGCFACKTEHWQGFNEHFIGFGGEEGYIHEKFRQAGGKAICLPDFKWVHRFGRPTGVPYPLCLEDRVFNYFTGWLEIYNDPEHQMIKDIYNHFKDRIPKGRIDKIFSNVQNGISGWR